MLKVENLTVRYGAFTVFENVSLSAEKQEIVGLIGPNGAGKTTLFNAISSFVQSASGKVFLDQKPITGKTPFQLRHLGITRTFQQVNLFEEYSIEENVRMAILPDNLAQRFVFSKNQNEQVRRTLVFSGLYENKDMILKDLPFGLRRIIQLAVASATQPKVLLLDEPAAGLNYQELLGLKRMILKIRQRYHCAVVLIDHNMDFVMDLVERIYVLADQQIIAEGLPAEIKANPLVLKAYLGEDALDGQEDSDA